MVRLFAIFIVPPLVFLTGSAYAIEPIPQEPGWSGHLRLGAGGFSSKTNMIAGISNYSIEVGDSRIDSLDDSASTNSTPAPQVNLNVKYTFSTQTQLFLGNSLEDVVQLDLITLFGARQQFSDSSIVELSAVTTPSFGAAQTWEDPYVVGEDREETDRTARGLRIEYDRILGSGFGVQYTQRENEIDNELSGTTQLGLSAEEAQLLDRNGDRSQLFLSYRFNPVKRSRYTLRLGFGEDDLDGEAMSGDMTQLQLTYAHLGDRFVNVVTASYFSKEFDAVNPVFDKTRDDDGYGLAYFVFDTGLFDSKDWWGQASIGWIEQDSNIDFYDQGVASVILGVQRNF